MSQKYFCLLIIYSYNPNTCNGRDANPISVAEEIRPKDIINFKIKWVSNIIFTAYLRQFLLMKEIYNIQKLLQCLHITSPVRRLTKGGTVDILLPRAQQPCTTLAVIKCPLLQPAKTRKKEEAKIKRVNKILSWSRVDPTRYCLFSLNYGPKLGSLCP